MSFQCKKKNLKKICYFRKERHAFPLYKLKSFKLILKRDVFPVKNYMFYIEISKKQRERYISSVNNKINKKKFI